MGYPMARKRTLQDIARLAKVSPSMVSRVFHGGARVDYEVVRTVRLAAIEFGLGLLRYLVRGELRVAVVLAASEWV